MIYLDNAASTKISDKVKNKLFEVLDIYGNPSSQHQVGTLAKQEIINAKKIIAQRLRCKSNDLYFTSGATMSNNLAIMGFFKKNPNGLLITDSIEHNDIMMLADEYFTNSVILNVNRHGFVNIEELEKILSYNTDIPILVSIQSANSEIGTIQNIKLISDTVHKYPNAYFHTDATQYIPWYSIDLDKLNIDMLSMSGQKIHCIKGTGLLYVKNGTPISSVILGEQGLVGGTENVLGIACLGEAFGRLQPDERRVLCAYKKDYLRELLPYPLVGSASNRLPNNLCLEMPGINADEFVELLSQNGICASAGSACSSYTNKPSHVLLAIGLTSKEANSCVRFTLDEDISYEELDEAAKIINACYRLMKND